MKLLALRLCAHDSNVTYFDGEKLKYRSFERDFQVKHFGFEGLYGWTRILNEWNIIPSEVDAVGIVMDTYVHREVTSDASKVTEAIEIPIFRDLGFKCNIHRIDHHYAHSLSFWPLGIEPTIHFVFDGFGDDWMYRSVWRGDKLLDSGKTDHGSVMFSSSLGFIMSRMGNVLNLRGNYLDHAGKVMAMKAFGRKDLPDVVNVDPVSYTHLTLPTMA